MNVIKRECDQTRNENLGGGIETLFLEHQMEKEPMRAALVTLSSRMLSCLSGISSMVASLEKLE